MGAALHATLIVIGDRLGLYRAMADGSHVPINALTAADRDRCLAAGMDGFISKPLDVNRLLEIVSGYALAPRLPEPESAS